jgi:hypothetical protein
MICVDNLYCMCIHGPGRPFLFVPGFFFKETQVSFSTDDRAGSGRADGQLLRMSVQHAVLVRLAGSWRC